MKENKICRKRIKKTLVEISGYVHKRLNPSSKICSSAVDGQSFFVIDGSLLTSFVGEPWGQEISSFPKCSFLERTDNHV